MSIFNICLANVAVYVALLLGVSVGQSNQNQNQYQLQYTVREDEAAPIVIGNLTADVVKNGILQSVVSNDSADNYLLSFSCEQQPSLPQGLVVESGRLLSRSFLDREVHGSSIALNVLLAVRRRNASPSERPFRLATIRVTINVTDVNDNAPIWPDYAFDENVITIQFSESAPLGSSQSISAASDADIGVNGLISYAKSCSIVTSNGSQLCGGADPFDIKVSQSSSGSVGEIAVVLNLTLDRESVAEYSFVITALDHGTPAKSGSLSLRVLVADVNDNAPTFTQPNYTVSLAENYPVNQPFLRVSAFDPDDGSNGLVSYSIRSASLPDYVTINQFTGDLSFIRQLDYEIAPVIDVRVQARDDDRPPKSSTAAVLINVIDINDAAPFISVHDCGDAAAPSIEIDENMKPFSTSCRIAAYDDDAGPAGEVHCEVLDAEAQFFDLEFASPSGSASAGLLSQPRAVRNPSYFLRLIRPLDRESLWQHDVRVQCVDHGSPAQSSQTHIVVHVTDVNDCTPMFFAPRRSELETIPASDSASSASASIARLFAQVRENSEPGTVITRLSASDCDEGVNSRLEFSIVNQSLARLPHLPLTPPLFVVDRQTGEVSLGGPTLDRESESSYLLYVLVKDSAANSLNATGFLQITVLDENDNPSVLTERRYEMVAEENAVGLRIGQLAAVDRDVGENAKFTFHLEEQSGDSERHRFKFHLDEFTGELTNLVKLDREQDAFYRFTVRVVDRYRKYNDTAQLLIRVADVNDNRPEFLFPTPTNYNTHITYPLIGGDNITKVLAVDADAAENGTVYYSLTEYQQLAPRLFDVNPQTGVVYLKRELEPSDLKGHKLVVRAHDGGSTPLINDASLYVYLDKGALPAMYVRPETGGQLHNQLATTARSNFSGMNDALMLTVFLCAVFVCVIVLASVALLVLFRRYKHQRRMRVSRHDVHESNPAKHRNSVSLEEAEAQASQRIFVTEKGSFTLKPCTLNDSARLFGCSIIDSLPSNSVPAGDDSASNSCVHEAIGCSSFVSDTEREHNNNSSANTYSDETNALTSGNLRRSNHSRAMITKNTTGCVSVIDKAYRETCTPVWKPRINEKACENPDCVTCRTFNKSATLCSSPKMARQPSSHSTTIARDYAVGIRLADSQRVARRKHVEIRSPTTSPTSARTVELGENDFEAESQNRRNDKRAELAGSESEAAYSCNQVLLAGGNTATKSGVRQKDHSSSRLSPSDYVTAVAVHLRSDDTQSSTNSKGRSDTLKSFNMCPIDPASYV